MSNWIKRWRDWLMRELFWPLQRTGGPQAQGLHFAYEKAGLLVRNEPIPWNAESVVIEALIRFPTSLARRKTDFSLHVPNMPPLGAVTLHRHEQHDVFRLIFRLPPIRQTTPIELYWRSYLLSQAVLPLLPADEFLENLRLEHSTIFARLGSYNVPCQAVVGTQCKGLLASGMLISPTCLVPLMDLDIAVEFVDQRSDQRHLVPVRLTSNQWGSSQALLSVVPPRRPRRLGVWSANWMIAGHVLARSEVRVISQRTFRRSLVLAGSRYVCQDKKGVASLTRHLPVMSETDRLGPAFLVASKEPGVAALCPLEVRVHQEGGGRTSPLQEQEVLVTDGPSLFTPGTLAVEDAQNVTAFELIHHGQSLGMLSMCPTPTATFTSEGGFEAHDEYQWGAVAEEELGDRLSKLTETPLEKE